ncbi:MAG: GntR family transcriptional regulator [Candidatus Omnitrophica bacterium]|nr:GntR family transcriptional regulator [Candidatus Omnitrophota bacterium]
MNENMFMEISPGPVYLNIEKKLREEIVSGHLKVGSKLTPEPELAKQFGASRETLRKALAILTRDGFLIRVPGRGTFVTNPDDKTSADFRSKIYHLRRLNHAIGILVPSVTVSVYAGIIKGAEGYFRKHGYHALLGNYDGQPEKEMSYLEMFAERGVAGVLACPGHNSTPGPYRKWLVKRKVPFVLAATSLAGLKADLVKTDNISASREATSCLLESGCRRIAFLCQYLSSSNSSERLTGYREALLEHGQAVEENYILERSSPEYQEKLLAILKEQVEGFVSANESTTMDLVLTLNKRYKGRRWPKIMAFDRPPLLAPGRYAITFFHQPAQEIGQEAAEILLQRLREQPSQRRETRRKTVILPVRRERFRFSLLARSF